MENKANFNILPNGDILESGVTPNPELDNKVVPFEEVRRENAPLPNRSVSWILHNKDLGIFLGKVGDIYIACKQKKIGEPFSILREDLAGDGCLRKATTNFGDVDDLSTFAKNRVSFDNQRSWAEEDVVAVGGYNYIVIGKVESA